MLFSYIKLLKFFFLQKHTQLIPLQISFKYNVMFYRVVTECYLVSRKQLNFFIENLCIYLLKKQLCVYLYFE